MSASCVVHAATLRGVQAVPVEVEVCVSNGMPGFSVVGMADASVQESRERVRAALRACGFSMPSSKVVVNLAPSALRKTGSGFDLPIAVGLLCATGQVNPAVLDGVLFAGELSLEGAVRPIAGLLAYALCAQRQDLALVSAAEDGAGRIEGIGRRVIESLGQLRRGEFAELGGALAPEKPQELDFRDIAGHDMAKRAFQIAAAGGHGLLMMGPPGSGKTMLASRLPSILAPLSRSEALEAAVIHSVAGRDAAPLLAGVRSFHAPHHCATLAGLVGGGSPPRPGAISLAHNGVLFLDELPEFSRESLEVLRQPLEDGQITVSRAAGSATYPSRFQLVAAMNPCKCGYYGHPTRACTCSPSAVRQYRSRVSGPLLDRIDLCVEMDPIAFDELHTAAPSESSAELRKQVLAARAIQAKRYAAPGFKGVHCNAQLNAGQVRRICRMTPGAEQLLRSSYDALGLSARAHDRILRVARTVADLAGKTLLDEDSLLEALQYRAQEKLDG